MASSKALEGYKTICSCIFVRFVKYFCMLLLFFKKMPKMSGSKHKSSTAVFIADTAKKHQSIMTETKVKIMERAKGKMELEAQRKETRGSRSNWRSRFTKQNMAENGKGVFFEEALSVLEAWNLNTEWFTTAPAATQNVAQCYHVIYRKKNRATRQTPLDRLFPEGGGGFLLFSH